MSDSLCLLYDGSFDGFLTCVFYAYEEPSKSITIIKENTHQNILFAENVKIYTDKRKSDRVWAAIKKKSSQGTPSRIFYAFLSEQTEIENNLFKYISYIIDSNTPVDKDYSNPIVLNIAKVAKQVGREKHRMEAFVRFRFTKEEVYFAIIEPDFNVLPIILNHFKERYPDQKWLVYDLKRKYGINYDLRQVEFVNLDFTEKLDPQKTQDSIFHPTELDFQRLWFNYFNSTNIKSRKNMALHIKHVPRRYWKYLSEKGIQ